MHHDTNGLVAKVWNFAQVLRDQGISYGDDVEQITDLLFPRGRFMAAEDNFRCGQSGLYRVSTDRGRKHAIYLCNYFK